MSKNKKPLMLCTEARGGMRSVVEAYERDGVCDRWQFQYLWTHCEGGLFVKLAVGLRAYCKMLLMLCSSKVLFIHAHAAMRGSFWRKSLFVRTAQLFGVPCILHLHGSEMETFYNNLSSIGKLFVRNSLESVDVVIVLSESWKAFILKAAPKANIAIINNYITLPIKLPAKELSASFDVLFLGVLGQRKGIYDLLTVWPEVLKSVPEAKLLIGGNGEVEESKRLVNVLGIDHAVEFLGWVDSEGKTALLERVDAFVLPSYNEGLPISVLEAMSYQVPVVTTTVGGIPELIQDSVNGILIQPGDQSALSLALVRLGMDSNVRVFIGSAGRTRVEQSFSDRIILPQLEQIYANIRP